MCTLREMQFLTSEKARYKVDCQIRKSTIARTLFKRLSLLNTEGHSFRIPAVGADHNLEVTGLADPLEVMVVVG